MCKTAAFGRMAVVGRRGYNPIDPQSFHNSVLHAIYYSRAFNTRDCCCSGKQLLLIDAFGNVPMRALSARLRKIANPWILASRWIAQTGNCQRMVRYSTFPKALLEADVD
jgi:hypothetical protein